MSDIYLDNNATTALDPRVLDAMLPTLRAVGNPSSGHAAGQLARDAVETARRQVANLLSASPREIVFTSGATEANNLALQGLVRPTHARRRIVTAATEHPSVTATARAMTSADVELVVVGVDRGGNVDLDELSSAVNGDTLLVTVMAANNETGVLAPLAAIAQIAHRHGALFHSDATQLLAWGPLDVPHLDVDLLSLSGHKMHGPQGVGALYVGRHLTRRLEAIQHGGGHEHGLRSGTLNTAGIVGLGAAAELANSEGQAAADRVRILRDDLQRRLTHLAAPVVVNGGDSPRLPGTLNAAFVEADAEAVMAGVPQIALATGSACATGHPGPSHVLSAMGIDAELAASSLRFGLSRFTTEAEVREAAELVAASVSRVRAATRKVSAS